MNIKINIKYTCLLVIGLLCLDKTYSQQKKSSVVEIGKLCPFFEINGVRDFHLKKVTPADFKGKWLILDFWDKYCMSCIQSLPKNNALQLKFKDKIQYLVIGKQDADGGIRRIYDKFKKSLNLKLANGFDSVIFRKFGISTCPRIIIVAPNGTVRGITNDLNEENISDLIHGKKPRIDRAYLDDEEAPLKKELKGDLWSNDSTLLFKSVLNKWTLDSEGVPSWKVGSKNGCFETLRTNVSQLYMLAYFGQLMTYNNDPRYFEIAAKPVFEIADQGKDGRPLVSDECYNYRVMVPPEKSKPSDIMTVMQNDLRSYFGYDAIIENRLMPCWKLTATKDAVKRLKTKGGTRYFNGRIDTGFVAKNFPVKELIRVLSFLKLPVLDQTGIEDNIDVEMKYILTNFEGIQKGLKENGLLLVPGEIKLKVLVIRDSKENTTL